MKERKKIVLFADKLESGGVEVSLVNFINKVIEDKRNIDITLVLLKAKGIYLENLEKKCNIIEIPIKDKIYIETLDKRFNNIKCIKGISNKLKFIYMKLLRVISRERYYKRILEKTQNLDEQYDLAIDFHGYGYLGTCYAIDKVDAKNKILFIHDENIKWVEKIKHWLKFYDKFYCVSESCAEILKQEYSEVTGKTEIFHNIINQKEIIEKSLESIDITMTHESINLLTIGRLEYQKGYDLLIDICKELRKEEICFRWYVIGTGSEKEKIEKWINENNLQQEIILLGMKKNPYPYLKACDIYVQPSRHEGYGIAIAEARCLNKPIVATNIKCIEEQIINNKTGVLCEFNKDVFIKEIKKLIQNEDYRKLFSENLKKDRIKTKNDIDKIYELLD